MYPVDLSPFVDCTIPRVKLVDLMLLPEFRARLNAYDGRVDDAWVCRTAQKVEKQLRTSPNLAQRIIVQHGEESLRRRRAKQHRCHGVVKYLMLHYPQHFREEN